MTNANTANPRYVAARNAPNQTVQVAWKDLPKTLRQLIQSKGSVRPRQVELVVADAVEVVASSNYLWKVFAGGNAAESIQLDTSYMGSDGEWNSRVSTLAPVLIATREKCGSTIPSAALIQVAIPGFTGSVNSETLPVVFDRILELWG